MCRFRGRILDITWVKSAQTCSVVHDLKMTFSDYFLHGYTVSELEGVLSVGKNSGKVTNK